MAIKFPVPFELAYWCQGFLFKAMEDPARQKKWYCTFNNQQNTLPDSKCCKTSKKQCNIILQTCYHRHILHWAWVVYSCLSGKVYVWETSFTPSSSQQHRLPRRKEEGTTLNRNKTEANTQTQLHTHTQTHSRPSSSRWGSTTIVREETDASCQ